METLSVSEFRKNMSSCLDRAERGETIFIRRKGKIYALYKVGDAINNKEQQLRASIEAIKAHLEGKDISNDRWGELPTEVLQGIVRGLEDVLHGRTYKMLPGETFDEMIDRIGDANVVTPD